MQISGTAFGPGVTLYMFPVKKLINWFKVMLMCYITLVCVLCFAVTELGDDKMFTDICAIFCN